MRNRSIQIEQAENLIQDLYDRISLAPDSRRELETVLRHGLKQLRTATTRSLNTINADLTEADELITIALDIAQHAGTTYRQAPEHIRRMFNQLLFEKLLVTTDNDGSRQIDATYKAPFEIVYGPDSRALVHEARRS